MVHVILASAVLVAFLGRKKSRYALTVGFFILFLFAALRYMYGSDYINYLNAYNRIKLGLSSHFDEKTFVYLNKISPSFQLLIAASSAVFVSAAYKLVRQNVSRRHAWISLFIFVISPPIFLMNLSAIRQCMAMVMFMAAVRYGMDRKLIPYVCLVIMGSLFHKSAIILLPVYLIFRNDQFKRRHMLLVLVLAVVLFWFTNLSEVAMQVAVWFEDNSYARYASNDMRNSLRATLLTGISFLYVFMNIGKLEGTKLAYAKLALVGYGMGILAFRLSMFTRIQMYFDIFTVVAIPTIMEAVNAEGKIRISFANPQQTVWRCINKYVLPTLIIMVYFLRYYSFFTNPMWRAFFTYQTIFSIM